MSSESIDLLWDESIKELQQLVDIERGIDESKRISINDAYRHFTKLYVKYTVVLSKLNKCYDLTVQPQKRLDIKSTLAHVICRVINLRHLLVKWAPPNPDVLSKDGTQQPFAWEYPDLNERLRELQVVPSHLGTDTPSFFKEENLQNCRARNALVLKLLKEKYGDVLPSLEDKEWAVQPPSTIFSSTDNQACHHDASYSIESSSGKKENLAHESNQDLAATKIQANLRMHLGQKQANKIRNWLNTFVGMKAEANSHDRDQLVKNLDDVQRKRKQEQAYCREKYNHDRTRLKDVVKDEEGFRMEVDLREERIKWITDQIVSNNAIPDSFEGFYTKDVIPSEIPEAGKAAKANTKDDNAKNSKDKDKSVAVEIELPSISAPLVVLESLTESIATYRSRWQHRNIGPDRVQSQYHDEELAKTLIIRDQVKSELTAGVEEKLLSNLLKIKAAEDVDKKKSKSKKDTGKKGKGKKAGGKGKKEKPLPGAKLPGMKEMQVEEMLQELVDHGLVCIPAQHVLNDLIGGYDSQPPKVKVQKDNVSTEQTPSGSR